MKTLIISLSLTTAAYADMPLPDLAFLSVECHPQSYWDKHAELVPYVLPQDVCVPTPRPDPRKRPSLLRRVER